MVEFADYAPLPEDYIGHPQGLEWFCNDHLNAAQALSDKSYEEAIKVLKAQFRATNNPAEQSTQPANRNTISRFFGFLKS